MVVPGFGEAKIRRSWNNSRADSGSFQGGGALATPPPMNKGKEETMVAHKVALRVVPDCMPTTAGALGVPAVFFSGGGI